MTKLIVTVPDEFCLEVLKQGTRGSFKTCQFFMNADGKSQCSLYDMRFNGSMTMTASKMQIAKPDFCKCSKQYTVIPFEVPDESSPEIEMGGDSC